MKFNELFSVIGEAKLPAESYATAYKTVQAKLRAIQMLFQKFIQGVLDHEDWIVNDLDALDIDSYFVKMVKELNDRMFGEDDRFYNKKLTQGIREIEQYLNTARTTEDGNFRYKIISDYLPNAINYLMKDIDPEESNYTLRTIMSYLNNFVERGIDYGFPPEEYQIIANLDAYLQQAVKLMKEIREYVERVTTLGAWNQGEYYHARNFRPDDLEEIEIAYHATLHAPEIFENGFQVDYDQNLAKGLGGASYKGDISFSLSLQICQTIATSLKRMWLIANGKWSADKVIQYVKDFSTNPQYDFNLIVKQFQNRRGAAFPPKTPEDLIEFYMVALWFMEKPVNRNPVFADTDGASWIQKLRSVKYSDIGIIKAKIRTTNASEFLVAEREIRIPPTDVVEMINIIQ